MHIRHVFTIPLLAFALVAIANAQEGGGRGPESTEGKNMSGEKVLTGLVGEWKGTCRTWFEPGKLADESEIAGEIVAVPGGPFVRHTYKGAIQGKPRQGEELIAFNTMTKSFQSSWIDDFHMNYAIMFSEGKQTEHGFNVRGEYDVGENQPRWGWRTEYTLTDENRLTITAFNILPDGREAKAVAVAYERVK